MNPFFPNRAERLLARRPTATAVLIEGTAAGHGSDRSPGNVLPAPAEGLWPVSESNCSAMIAEENRARVSADLTGPGLTICLWLAVAALLGVAAMHFIHQLAVLDASLACAARV